MKGLIGKKVGMTQVFDESGNIVPVTLIEAGPCYVTIIRHPKRDHYKAVQLGFGEAKPKHLSGGQLGHLKKNDLPPLRYLREFRVKSVEVPLDQRAQVQPPVEFLRERKCRDTWVQHG